MFLIISLRCKPRGCLQNTLTVLSLTEGDEATGTSHSTMAISKPDVWDVRWATDDPQAFATMDKTKLTIMRDLHAEAPIVTNHFLVAFGELEAEMVDLDTLMQNPEVRQHLLRSVCVCQTLVRSVCMCHHLVHSVCVCQHRLRSVCVCQRLRVPAPFAQHLRAPAPP